MRSMRYADNGSCGLSKGTQSDGLISDTSTEEFESGSSTENLKEGIGISEKVVAKETEEVRNELQKSSIDSKPSISLHQMQTQCRSYIRWGVLLSFGIFLWVALWITDIFKPNPFLKEDWLADLATAKKGTSNAGIVRKPAPSTWWFFNLWNYMFNSIISVTSLEIFTFMCCIITLVYLEARTRNKWGETIGKLCYDQFYKSLLNTGSERSGIDTSDSHLEISGDELAAKNTEMRSYDDELSKFNHGDVTNLMIQDQSNVISKSGGKTPQRSNQGIKTLNKNRLSKSLKGSHNTSNNIRKRSLQLNSAGKNTCNFSRKCDKLSHDVITSEVILDEPRIGPSRLSSMSRNDKIESIPEQSENLTCSIFNKSTSFVSEEIETWFEVPNSDRAERVMHSFELGEFFNTRNNTSPLSFIETTQDLHPFNDCSEECDCAEESSALVPKYECNGGIVSSSPEFRRFLMNLAKDRLSEPYS